MTDTTEQNTLGRRPTLKEKDTGKYINHKDGSREKKYAHAKAGSFTGSYQQWLKDQLKKDPEFVKSILGEKRFKLFSEGKFNIKSMVADGNIKKFHSFLIDRFERRFNYEARDRKHTANTPTCENRGKKTR